MASNHSNKQIAVAIIVVVAITFFTIYYTVPNVFGHKFITGEITPIFKDDKMHAINFTAINNYFTPVALSYPGADIVIDVFNNSGKKVHRLTFLSDSLHDDEEGYAHLARLAPGNTTFTLDFTESSQYLRNYTNPILEYGQYTLIGNAFGIGFEDDKDPI